MGGRGAETERPSKELPRVEAYRCAVVPERVVQRSVLVAGDGEDVDNPERQRTYGDGKQNQVEAAGGQ